MTQRTKSSGGFWRRCISRTAFNKKNALIDTTTCDLVPAAEAKRRWSASTDAASEKRRAQGLAFCEGCRR